LLHFETMNDNDTSYLPITLTGAEAIRAALADMPGQPGIYRMMNRAGEALYIGKARNLKNRVTSYASTRQLTNRILRMVEQVVQVEYIVTASEAEALLLEANLIKKHKPRYNILLKDDKSFPYLYIDTTHPFPRIAKHRGTQKGKGDYFGPFASVGALNETLGILQKAFLLRPCADNIFNNRTRPCLQYQIKRCSAPCVKYINETDYNASLTQARDFLRGRNREVQESFVQQMQAFSESQEYEKAALLRDRIRALNKVQAEQAIRASGLDDADLIALSRSGDHSCIQVAFYRNGAHFGNMSFFPRHSIESTEDEILSAFIAQFYQAHLPPGEILLNYQLAEQTLLEEALCLQAGYKVCLRKPQRGDKLALLDQAALNAKAALDRHVAARMSEAKYLEGVAKLFGMPAAPQRIEVYDNSHIQGRHALGAMIVAGPEGFTKSAYRRFNIRSTDLSPGDDYAMMREVFTRRFGRLQKEDPDRALGHWPDLVLIDGGAGQLSAARDILADLGIHGVCYLAIAKGPDRNAGREQFFIPDKTPFTLPPNDPVLHYLQRLRDEAHRFAISSHRIKRSKSLSESTLDEVPGIGATRKRALLHHFGSRTEVAKASLAALEQVPGISKKMARVIYDYFQG
jgi:excinuclease ABC subunit C